MLFHHLGLTTLLYHIPIKLVISLLLVMRGATSRIICRLTVVSLIHIIWNLFKGLLWVYLLICERGRLHVFIYGLLIDVVMC